MQFAEWCLSSSERKTNTPDRPFSLFEGGTLTILCGNDAIKLISPTTHTHTTHTHTHTYTHTHTHTHTNACHGHIYVSPRRVLALLSSAREKVTFGGDTDDGERYISPTLITNVTGEDDIMKEEIFVPLLPFVTIDSIDAAVEFVNSR